jgi:hypothetical protein
VKRFQLKPGSKRWNDPGPDLLRPRDNARARLRALLGPPAHLKEPHYQIDDRDWTEVDDKAAMLEAFDAWKPEADGALFTAAEMRNGQRRVIGVVRLEQVEVVPLEHCSPETAEVHALLRHAFPGSVFSGGYVWKETSPEVWSDHAWGTAFDRTANPPAATNEAMTDWLARMGRARCCAFGYLLGSRDGQVVQAGDPDYELEPSSASSSHLWHVHCSVVDHDGRKPPRQGGAW